MNHSHLIKILKATFSVFVIILFTGCTDYLDDPLIDKTTGKEIEFFIIDEEIFNTRMSFKLLDAESNELIKSNATVVFNGQNGNDIITYTGKRQSIFYTNQGRLELTVDPNVSISEDSPFKYIITIEIQGYQTFTQELQIVKQEKQTVELRLARV
jgi:hypothetical protein